MLKRLEEIAEVKSIKKVDDDNNCLWVLNVSRIQILRKPGDYQAKYLFKIIPDDLVEVNYLYYVLEKPLGSIVKNINKVVPKINLKQLREIEVPILPIDEQRKILKSKDPKKTFEDLWKEYDIIGDDEPLKINMSFEDALKFILQQKKK
jgi:hypothetical protein